MSFMESISSQARPGKPGANQTQFLFNIKGYADDALSVLAFSGRDFELSHDYVFNVRIKTDLQLDIMATLGRTARLELLWDYAPVFVHGVVTELLQDNAVVDGHEYEVEIASPLHPLRQRFSNRVFVDKGVKEIVSEVLNDAGWAGDAYTFQCENLPPAWDFVAQADEDDLAFIERLLARAGLFYRFEQDKDSVRLVLNDSVNKLPKLPGDELRYEVQKGENRLEETLYTLSIAGSLLTRRYLLKDYNDDTPEADLSVVSSGADSGSYGDSHLYGGNYRTVSEGRAQAQFHQDATDWRRVLYVGQTDCRGLMPGMVVKVTGHPQPALNTAYTVVKVEPEGDQRAAFAYGDSPKGTTYRAALHLIPAGIPFRVSPPLPRTAPGMMTARIESTGGDYAHLDEQGRYRLRMDFDNRRSGQAQASLPVRLAQPYAGSDYGFHFPLHAGTEVLVGFVNNDIDRPYIVGAVNNAETPSPVTATNKTQNVLRTWGGNELTMDDQQGKEKIELFTRDRKLSLSLDATAQQNQVRLATEEGDMKLHAGKGMVVEAGGNQDVSVGKDYTVTVGNAQRLVTKKAGISFDAATDLLLKAAQNLRLQTDQGGIEHSAEKMISMEAGSGLAMEVKKQDAQFLVDSGNLKMKVSGAVSVLGQGKESVFFGQGGGGIEIKSSGDVAIKGSSTISLDANTISVKGQGIGNNS